MKNEKTIYDVYKIANENVRIRITEEGDIDLDHDDEILNRWFKEEVEYYCKLYNIENDEIDYTYFYYYC